MTASTPGTWAERWLQSVRNWITARAASLQAGVWRGCNSKLTVRLVFRSLIGGTGGTHFHARAEILARLRLGRIGAIAHWACGGGSPRARSHLAACLPEGKNGFRAVILARRREASALRERPLQARGVVSNVCCCDASVPSIPGFRSSAAPAPPAKPAIACTS